MDVAIIGSGAAGTLAAIHLLRLSRGGQTRVRLTLFEKQAHQYLRGIAYSTLSSHHVLNVPSHHMSALPEEPDHYHDWLEKNAPLVTEPFSPRMVFGQYLEATLTAEVNAKAPSVEFVPELDAVMDVRATSDGRWALETASGSLPLFDKVIFATGNLRPREPKELTIHAAKHPRYYPNPWNLHHHQWPRESSVLFIGTGLSMLDGVLELWSREHRGRIVAFSRKGLLPRPHGSGTTFRMDIPALRALGRVRERLAFVRNCVVKHVEAGGIWQDVMASLRAHTTELWQTLSDQERERFLRHLKSYWESHRHRSPVPQLDLVETLRGRGQMSVRQGRLRRIDHDGVSFLVGWNGDAGTERFDIVGELNGTNK